jgi:hypothetical protein
LTTEKDTEFHGRGRGRAPSPPAPGYQSRVDYKPGQFVQVVISGNPVGQITVDEILP